MRKARLIPVKRRVHIEMLGGHKARFTTFAKQKIIDLNLLPNTSVIDLNTLAVTNQTDNGKVGWVLSVILLCVEDQGDKIHYQRAYQIYARQSSGKPQELVGVVEQNKMTHYYPGQGPIIKKESSTTFELTFMEEP